MVDISRNGDIVSVGFRDEKFLGEAVLPKLRENVEGLVAEKQPSAVRFDLTDIMLVTSEILGFFVSLRKKDLKVILYNPSGDVREVVEMTKLDSLLDLVDEPKS